MRLKKYIKSAGVTIVNEQVVSVKTDPLCVLTDGKCYNADAVIIATGGLSYPATGSTGDGFRFARELSHRLVKPEPALVSLIGSQEICAGLAGLSLKMCVSAL